MTASIDPLHGFHPGLTVGQVASRLKISPSTARRWVRSGRLPSTRVRVGDGFEYRVPVEALGGLEGSVNPSVEDSADPSRPPSMKDSAPSDLEVSVERSTAMAAYNAQLIAPLVAVIERQAEQLVTQAETIGRQAERVAGLELENGRLMAENRALVARTESQSAEAAQEPPGSRWRMWAPGVLTVLTTVALVVLLAWSR